MQECAFSIFVLSAPYTELAILVNAHYTFLPDNREDKLWPGTKEPCGLVGNETCTYICFLDSSRDHPGKTLKEYKVKSQSTNMKDLKIKVNFKNVCLELL